MLSNGRGIVPIPARLAILVYVDIDHDTAEFAVESIRRWWRLLGKKLFPAAKSIFVTADGGGSNSSRKGQPLVSMEAIINLIGHTTSKTGSRLAIRRNAPPPLLRTKQPCTIRSISLVYLTVYLTLLPFLVTYGLLL